MKNKFLPNFFKSLILWVLVMAFLLLILSLSYDIFSTQGEKVILDISGTRHIIEDMNELEGILKNNEEKQIDIAIVDTQGAILDKKSLSYKDISASFIEEKDLDSIRYSLEKNKFLRFFRKMGKLEFEQVWNPFVQLKKYHTGSIKKQVLLFSGQLSYNNEQLKDWVVSNIYTINRSAKEASFVIEDGNLVQTQPEKGVSIDLTEAMEVISEAISEERMNPVSLKANVSEFHQINKEELEKYNKIIGHSSVKINGSSKDVLFVQNKMLEILRNKGIMRGARFSLCPTITQMYNDQELKDERFQQIIKEYEQTVATMLYNLTLNIQTEDLVYWDRNISVGDPKNLLTEEKNCDVGLIFVNRSEYNIIVPVWYDGERLNIAFVGSIK